MLLEKCEKKQPFGMACTLYYSSIPISHLTSTSLVKYYRNNSKKTERNHNTRPPWQELLRLSRTQFSKVSQSSCVPTTLPSVSYRFFRRKNGGDERRKLLFSPAKSSCMQLVKTSYSKSSTESRNSDFLTIRWLLSVHRCAGPGQQSFNENQVSVLCHPYHSFLPTFVF